MICNERENGYRENKKQSVSRGGSTQRDMRCHSGERTERDGGTGKERRIRYRSSSEGGRETLTTDTGWLVGAKTGLYSIDKVTMKMLK